MIDETIWLSEGSSDRVQATILKERTVKSVEIYGINPEKFDSELEEVIELLYPGWYVVTSWID